MRLRSHFILLVFVLMGSVAFGQCPENIGFDLGSFKNWKCYLGLMETAGLPYTAPESQYNFVPTDFSSTRHTILVNQSPQTLDPYGQFPVNCPNGNVYSVQLGDENKKGNNGGYAESMTYDFVVPKGLIDFTLIYYYAVVFQNPKDHNDNQQPMFIANVYEMVDGQQKNTTCGAFHFTSNAGLQGFKKSDYGADVYYKPWSPLTIKLSGYQGKTIRVEFITRDCSKGGHFGYAYIGFNSNCTSPISGNLYCAGQSSLTLTAPLGFETYKWTDDKDSVVSTSPTYKISQPFPPDGTKYNLSITPYDGLGCPNAFTTSIQKLSDAFNLKVMTDTAGCKSDGIDITNASVTRGSSTGMKFEYYTDPEAQNYLSDPKHVTESGTYYIRGTNAGGCTDIAPIHLDLYQGAALTIAAHPPICAPAKYNLTQLVSADQPVTYSYYSDAALKVQITPAQASAISKSGIYYVKAVAVGVPCITIEPVSLIISTPPADPDIKTLYASCPPLNLLTAIGNTGDNADGVFYTFYTDAAGKNVVDNPGNITLSGTYYYRGTNQYGCEGRIASVPVSVYPVPYFKVIDPDPVVYPQTVNLIYTHPPLTFANFTYWKDAACTKPLENYQTIGESGTFYIKAINTTGCEVSAPVHVQVNAPPEADLVGPNTFTPNGDGINDVFKPTTTGVLKVNYIKILNRYGNEVFYTNQIFNHWDGNYDGKPVPPGTYYWMFSAYDIYRKKQVMRSGKITLIR